jgi:hypothetical protein
MVFKTSSTPPAEAGGLCLGSTATQSTDADTLLWLLRATHQGRLPRSPSCTRLTGAGAFASSYSVIQQDRPGGYNGNSDR